MFDWFRRLIPQSGDFFSLFEHHSAACVAAAEALAKLTKGEGDPVQLCKEIQDREHEADEIIRKVLSEVRHTFLTPFDRGAIIALIGAMDDTIDEIHACATAIELYGFSDFEPEMKEMADKVLGAIMMIDRGLPLLRDVTRNGDKVPFAGLELTRFVGHLILDVVQGKEALGGSSSEVSRGVPA